MRNLSVIILTLFLVGCDWSSPNIRPDVVRLDPEKAQPTISSNLIEDIELIPLQTSDDIIIGEVTAVAEHDDQYFVFDSQTKSVFVFDLSGSFCYRICRVGKGPGEYINLDGMYIDHERNLLILDGGNKCLYYECADGKYIREERYAVLNGYKTYLGEGAFVSYVFYKTQKTNDKLVFERNGDIVSSALPIEKNMKSTDINTERFFYASDHHHFFVEPYQDTVYRLTPKSATVECIVDFGGKNLPLSYWENKPEENRLSTLYESSFCHSIENFYSNSFFTTFRYSYQDDLYFYFKQGKNDSITHTSYSKITDDLLGNTFLWINFLWCKENYTLSSAEMTQIQQIVQYAEGMMAVSEADFVSQQQGVALPELAGAFYRSMTKATKSEYFKKMKNIASFPEENNPVLIKLKWKDL